MGGGIYISLYAVFVVLGRGYIMKCSFSTDITDDLSCCQDGEFDDHGFPIHDCPQFPCAKYKEMRQKIQDDRRAQQAKIALSEGHNKGV